jgi:hypothetical protein
VAKVPPSNWQAVWSTRTGSVDATLLARTRGATEDMDKAAPRSADLSTLSDARMRRSSHSEHLPEARLPGEVTYLDVYASGQGQQPRGLNGERTSVRLAVLFVDAYSRFKRVYFCDSERDVPGLARHYLSELGHSVHCGGHFVLMDGCRKYIHTDGGASMNSQEFAKVLMDFGLASNVTSCPHTPSSNGVAERSFATICPDVRAALAMADMAHGQWSWALRHGVNARNKLATQRIVNAEGIVEWKTPFELYFRRRPSHKHSCMFGAPCRVLFLGEQRPVGKFSAHSMRGKILGRGEDGVQLGPNHRYMLGWIVLLANGKIHFSRHVQIDERSMLRPTIEGGISLSSRVERTARS